MKGRSSAKLKSFCSPPCLPFHQSCYDERESGLHRGKPPKRDDPFGRWFPFLFTKSRCRLFGFALTNSDAFAFNFVDIRHAMRALQVSFSACLPACLPAWWFVLARGQRMARVRPPPVQISSLEAFGGFRLKGPVQQFATA